MLLNWDADPGERHHILFAGALLLGSGLACDAWRHRPQSILAFRTAKYFKNIIAPEVCLLVEICPTRGTKIFIDVATQL
jgi:hypothetical protein